MGWSGVVIEDTTWRQKRRHPRLAENVVDPFFDNPRFRLFILIVGVHPVERVVRREVSIGADGRTAAGNTQGLDGHSYGEDGPPEAAVQPVRMIVFRTKYYCMCCFNTHTNMWYEDCSSNVHDHSRAVAMRV